MDDLDPDVKKLLQKTLRVAEENNKILRKMRRSMRWGSFFRLVYWVLIVGSAVGTYYILQPLFDSLGETYSSLQTGIEGIQGVGKGLPDLRAFFDRFGQ